MLDISGKGFKAAIINTSKKLKENMIIELKENMVLITWKFSTEK